MNDLRKFQLEHVELLKRFIEACDKLNVKYYAYCGTLLGAVRHNGFIPWDDDIDIAMFRYDFQKFMLKAPDLLPDLAFEYLDSCDHEKKRYFDFTGIARVNDYEKNIGLDIYPLDYLPIDFRKIVKFKRYLLMRAYKNREEARHFYPDHGFNVEPLKYADLLCSQSMTHQIMPKVSDLYHLLIGADSMIFDTKYFDRTVKLPFEDIMIDCPEGWRYILTQEYGDDYMTPKEYHSHERKVLI